MIAVFGRAWFLSEANEAVLWKAAGIATGIGMVSKNVDDEGEGRFLNIGIGQDGWGKRACSTDF